MDGEDIIKAILFVIAMSTISGVFLVGFSSIRSGMACCSELDTCNEKLNATATERDAWKNNATELAGNVTTLLGKLDNCTKAFTECNRTKGDILTDIATCRENNATLADELDKQKQRDNAADTTKVSVFAISISLTAFVFVFKPHVVGVKAPSEWKLKKKIAFAIGVGAVSALVAELVLRLAFWLIILI
ncbi:MAG: hypothetical protein V1887_02845, partial [Candidatus Aenigmatarchaeota archaeon]